LIFWILLAGLLTLALCWYFPTLPFDGVAILAAILFVLRWIGVVPQFRAQRALETYHRKFSSK
jgi:hypothetical protein